MKKIYFAMTALLSFAGITAQGQTILEEGFETSTTESFSQPIAAGEGWTTVNSYTGTDARYVWHNYYSDPESQTGPTISGGHVASCDGPIGSSTDGQGPREEILLTPELDLNDTYQLQFSWRVSPMNAMSYSLYDLQVRIVEDGNLQGAETVFSIQNEQMLRESGVTVFPIETWDVHVSKVDLSDWKGSKVKIAFVYKMYTDVANVVWLDDVSVKQFTPPTGPNPSLSLDRYDFKDVYIGESFYSELITLTNTGKNGLKITGMDLPQGISTTLDADKVDLNTYEKVQFQLCYTAAMTTPAAGKAVLHTTGGDVAIDFTASKQLVPEGYLLETFNDYFPPAGWKNSRWSWTTSAIEGSHSVYCGGDFSAAYLRSPRLDLSDGGKVSFTYYNQYDGDYAPEYDIELQVSYDGGDTWQTKWISDYENGLNQLLTAEVDLGKGTDESYIRWFYPAVESDDEGAYDHSSFTLDRVLLPHVFGADGVPGNATLVSPANNAEQVYPTDVVLEWGPAQFAKGYKLYVGTNTEANDLIDGEDVGSALTYTIAQRLAYETTYRWKVVGYNDKGASVTASTWRFTTQPDASVVTFPYEENFDACTSAEPVPAGWLSTSTEGVLNFAKWSPNTYYPYGGKGASLAAGWLNAGQSVMLTSPEFTLPAEGRSMSISFVWGNEHPSDLIVDETGLLQKENVPGGNGRDEVIFEIYSDGQWKQASYLSENHIEGGEKKYWRSETIDLDAYAGKTIQFRWTSHCIAGTDGYGTLDNVVIDGTVEDGVAFNKTEWNAGQVNYGKGASSKDLLTIRNVGKNDLTVKSATFKTSMFTTSIAAGQVLKKGEGAAFDITFTAKEAAKTVEDELTVEFESGSKATFPVSGESLAEDVLYYGFEKNALDYDWKTDFTQKDVDNKVNYDPSSYYQTEFEIDNARFAFVQVIHNNENTKAHSGIGSIAACAPDDNSAADDWLISKQLRPAEGATFDFYARNLSTTGSVFVGDNDLHRVTVLVSEAGNTNTADFKVVMKETEMPYLAENEWNHFSVDLSPYAGKNIYVAVRHTTISANWLAFFDDFTFTHVGEPDNTAINQVRLSDDTQIAVYNLNGVQVASGRGEQTLQSLAKGLYIVKTADGQTMRMARR